VARAVGESNVTCRCGRRRGGGGGGDEDDVRPGAWRARGTGAAAASTARWPLPPDVCRDDTNMPRRANNADSGIFRGGGDGWRCKASLASKHRSSGSAGRSMAVGDDKLLRAQYNIYARKRYNYNDIVFRILQRRRRRRLTNGRRRRKRGCDWHT